jgi:hypothetical protein
VAFLLFEERTVAYTCKHAVVVWRTATARVHSLLEVTTRKNGDVDTPTGFRVTGSYSDAQRAREAGLGSTTTDPLACRAAAASRSDRQALRIKWSVGSVLIFSLYGELTPFSCTSGIAFSGVALT